MLLTDVVRIEQLERDIQIAHTEVKEAKTGHRRVEIEFKTMQDELSDAKVGQHPHVHLVVHWPPTLSQTKYSKAEAKLKEERAVLTAFDGELAELDQDIKSKKQEVADSELNFKKLEHDIVLQNKERSSADALIENLETQFPWIKDEQK